MNAQSSSLTETFKSLLNRHGYGFQLAVYREIERLYNASRSRWVFQSFEFPVVTNGQATHIDLLLEYQTRKMYMIGECKRVNPAFGAWCFAKTPSYRRNRPDPSIIIESVNQCPSYSTELHTDVVEMQTENPIYWLGRAIKLNEKSGDNTPGKGSGPDAIEDAATQVCRGLNGFVNLIDKRRQLFKKDESIHLLPVLFTTAKLYSTELDISEIELATGNVNQIPALVEKPWLWFQYPQSATIIHQHRRSGVAKDAADILDHDYVRTIAVVSVDGIESFMTRDWNESWDVTTRAG